MPNNYNFNIQHLLKAVLFTVPSDMLDIVKFVTELFQDFTNASMITLETMFTSDARFSNTTVAEILKAPRQKPNPYVSIFRLTAGNC